MARFDTIVVGAGTAGCLAAKTMAESGLKVCLIDRKERDEIGEKVCGDALGEHHLKTVGLEKPQAGELEKRIEGVKIFSPDLESAFTIAYRDYIGYMLNRRLFGQWLLKQVVDTDAVLMDSTQCLEPIIEKGKVTGISARKVKTGENMKLKGKVVLDASGFFGVIRRKLPPEMRIETEVAAEDVEACYREIRQLKEEAEETKYCEIYLNQKITPGGYTWIFQKGGAKVNAGLGVCMRRGFPNPRSQFETSILPKPLFQGSLLLKRGAWYDPTRRPLDNIVGNGVAVLGDAACLVNPIHGGGIGPSMLSGYLAGKTVVEALEAGDVSQKKLWRYNYKYMEMYGTKQAGLDVFRMLLLTSRDEDLNYGMKHELMTEDDVLNAGLGKEFQFKVTETARRVFRGLKRMRFLNKLRLTVKLMNRVKAHYANYPEAPEEFEEWRRKTRALFQEVQSKLTD
ncbi:geranylgeranyl reductase family protein [Candidatus Bathyarchaeota archaeon]|nr:geranylgeranyl reductase family protein [Candidatus Bathyarchaeota archaeon]